MQIYCQVENQTICTINLVSTKNWINSYKIKVCQKWLLTNFNEYFPSTFTILNETSDNRFFCFVSPILFPLIKNCSWAKNTKNENHFKGKHSKVRTNILRKQNWSVRAIHKFMNNYDVVASSWLLWIDLHGHNNKTLMTTSTSKRKTGHFVFLRKLTDILCKKNLKKKQRTAFFPFLSLGWNFLPTQSARFASALTYNGN